MHLISFRVLELRIKVLPISIRIIQFIHDPLLPLDEDLQFVVRRNYQKVSAFPSPLSGFSGSGMTGAKSNMSGKKMGRTAGRIGAKTAQALQTRVGTIGHAMGNVFRGANSTSRI
jgi:hypothetical protein